MSSPLDRLPKNGDIIDFTTKEPSSNLQVYLETRNNFEYAHELAKKRLGVRPACRAGCTWCCTHDQPWLTPMEATALIELCSRDKSLGDVLDKALAHADWAIAEAGKPDVSDQTGHPMMKCIFLGENGRCRIYKKRPMACVGTFSFDAKACEASAVDKSRQAWTVDRALLTRIILKMKEYLPPERLEVVLAWFQRQKDENETMPLNMAIGLLLKRELQSKENDNGQGHEPNRRG